MPSTAEAVTARDIACPHCSARAGRACRKPNGKITETHSARRRAVEVQAPRVRAQASVKGGPVAYRVVSRVGVEHGMVVTVDCESGRIEVRLGSGECTERGLRAAVERAVK